MKVITSFNNPILSEKEYLDNEWQREWVSNASGPIDGPDESDAVFKNEMAEGEGEGEYWTAGGGSDLGDDTSQLDGPDESDAVFKNEMAEGEGEGEYWTAGGGSDLGVDGTETDAQFKREMAEGEGEGEYWTAGGGSDLGVDGTETDAQFKREMAEGEGEGEYWTSGGGSYLGIDGVEDNFTRKVITEGNVTVKTDNPVYQDTALQEQEWLSNFEDEDESDFLGSRANRRARRKIRRKRRIGRKGRRRGVSTRSGGRRRSGKVGDFFSKAGKFAKESGLLDYGRQALDQKLDGSLSKSDIDSFDEDPPKIDTKPKDKGLSTTAKIGIGIGVVALGVGVYFLMQKKGKKGKK